MTEASASRFPHADLWALGLIAFLSRVEWIVAFYYHEDPRAIASILVSLATSLLVTFAGYAVASLVRPRRVAFLTRMAVLAAFLFLVWVYLRQVVITTPALGTGARVLGMSVCLALSIFGASIFVAVWPRLRAALLGASVIGTASVFVMAAVLAKQIEILGAEKTTHRPVIVLLLDEMSGGAARDIVTELERSQLRVESSEVPSIGQNTVDVVPAMFTGVTLPGARPCTSTAICGHSRVVDFSRISVARNDVDVVGSYHRYCAIKGLRHCANPEIDSGEPLLVTFVCALPLRELFGRYLDCHRAGYDALGETYFAAVNRELFGAPFWSKGGLLYAHILMPHPPSAGGEVRLADAYAANLRRAGGIVSEVVDRLDQAPFREDYTLVITSDHHLRSELWCKIQPYAGHDCDLPAAMRSPGVPFIVATRGAPVTHRVPHSNVDLLPIVIELSGPR